MGVLETVAKPYVAVARAFYGVHPSAPEFTAQFTELGVLAAKSTPSLGVFAVRTAYNLAK